MGKKYFKYLIIAQLIVLIFFGTLNYIVDPRLYYSRDNRLFSPLYTLIQRHLIPGVIKNSPNNNAVIIGTSLTAPFIASKVSAILNTNAIKLTVNGATLFEQHFILSKYLQSHPNAKIVIWGVDPPYLSRDAVMTTQKDYIYPFFLYDTTQINYKYLFNYDVTKHSLQTIAANFFNIRFAKTTFDLDKIGTWNVSGQIAGCKKVTGNYQGALSAGNIYNLITEDFNIGNAEINLNNIIELAMARQDVQFFIFFPPYSILRYYLYNEHQSLGKLLMPRDFIAKKTKGIPNINILDLQASPDIISNLDYYADINHYNPAVADIILKYIVNGNFTDYNSILKNTEKLELMVKEFDFETAKRCEN